MARWCANCKTFIARDSDPCPKCGPRGARFAAIVGGLGKFGLLMIAAYWALRIARVLDPAIP